MNVNLACTAVLAVVIAGCAPRPQPVAVEPAAPAQPLADSPEYEAAVEALVRCGLREVVRLDDGRTDANTVARAAATRCRREQAGFQRAAAARARTPQAALAVDAAVATATQTTFASMVLEVRAYRRERGARAAPGQPLPPSRRPLDEVAL